MSIRRTVFPVLLAAIPLVLSSEASAQCSGGRGGQMGTSMRGASMSAMATGLTNPIASANSDSFARAYARQMQMYQAQQRSFAMRQQLMQQRAEQQNAKQHELLSIRQERARITREQRAARIAKAKAKREAERYADKSSDSDSVSATLVSFVQK